MIPFQEQEKYSVEIHAKPKHHRFLIGRNGVNIKKVKASSAKKPVESLVDVVLH